MQQPPHRSPGGDTSCQSRSDRQTKERLQRFRNIASRLSYDTRMWRKMVHVSMPCVFARLIVSHSSKIGWGGHAFYYAHQRRLDTTKISALRNLPETKSRLSGVGIYSLRLRVGKVPLARRRYIVSESEWTTKRKRRSSTFDISSHDLFTTHGRRGNERGGECACFSMYSRC